jgi:hypothetical protein
MPEPQEAFRIERETNEELQILANTFQVVLLAVIAPFMPARVAPRRVTYAEFQYPEEFMVEEFVNAIEEKYPNGTPRPNLWLLLHSFGGDVGSSYVCASVLREAFTEITAFVPHVSFSGGTMLALSSNQIVGGRITQLSPVDPYFQEGDETFYPASIVTAFRNLERYFGQRTIEEAPYPWQHLADSFTPEKFDRANRALRMVEDYLKDLLKKAGYQDAPAKVIVQQVLYNPSLHEQRFLIRDLKAFGVKTIYHHEKPEFADVWPQMRQWLKTYYMRPSPVHFVRYVLPEEEKQEEGGQDEAPSTN